MSPHKRGALGQPPLRFTSVGVDSNGAAELSASVQPWTHDVVLSSANLSDWSALTLAVSGTNTLTITGPPVKNALPTFYRATTPR
jgi:hypothetical protein